MEERPGTLIDDEDLFLILKLMEESGWDEIELSGKGFKFVVGKNLPRDYGGPSAAPSIPSYPREEKGPPAAPVATSKPKAEAADASETALPLDGTPVNAPMMGTFYRSPSPGAPPFIKVGDIVTARSIIGIIEVMKVMSSVEAGLAGRVSSILVEDGQLVQYNQPLLLIDCEEQLAEAAHE